MTPETERLYQIVAPQAWRVRQSVKRDGLRLAHYTSAATALRILKSQEVWLRNVRWMNDVTEIIHGRDLLLRAYNDSAAGKKFHHALDSVSEGLRKRLEDTFNPILTHIETETYISCLSIHKSTEDGLGRLSMWRGYGQNDGAALIVRSHPFMSTAPGFGPFSSSVYYSDRSDLDSRIDEIATNILNNRDFLRSMPPDTVMGYLLSVLLTLVVCTKHPGFDEEKEWRIIYWPTLIPTRYVQMATEAVRGVPETIYKIPLKDAPEVGMTGINVTEFIDHIIVGPSRESEKIKHAFTTQLRNLGVPNPESRVVESGIPYRSS